MNSAPDEEHAAAASLALFESQLAEARTAEAEEGAEGKAGGTQLLHRLHANASAAALAAGLPRSALRHARSSLESARSVEEEAKALYRLAHAALLLSSTEEGEGDEDEKSTTHQSTK